MQEIKAVACNYSVPVKAASRRSIAYVLNVNRGGGAERIEILSRSRDGRWINRWERIDRLTNFRFKTVVPENPIYNEIKFAPQAAVDPGIIEQLKSAELRERIRRLNGMRPSVFGHGFEDRRTAP